MKTKMPVKVEATYIANLAGHPSMVAWDMGCAGIVSPLIHNKIAGNFWNCNPRIYGRPRSAVVKTGTEMTRDDESVWSDRSVCDRSRCGPGGIARETALTAGGQPPTQALQGGGYAAREQEALDVFASSERAGGGGSTLSILHPLHEA